MPAIEGSVPVEVREVTSRRDLRAFVRFSWRVYVDDPNWVPPLIQDRMQSLNPAKGLFYRSADVALFLARRGREVVGTVAAFVERQPGQEQGAEEGGFGFFEAVDDDAVVKALLDAAFDWLRARGVTLARGPMDFNINECPGVLIAGADCPPVMLEAHTPPYYRGLLERYGMVKDHDLYAWRAFRSQVGEELSNLPPELGRVADVARRVAQVEIRKLRLEDWDSEIATACHLFNETLKHLIDHVPFSEAEFARLANQFRPFIDPDLALFAEADGQTIGFCIALPDVNRVLIHLNGRLFPLNWMRLRRYIRQIDVVSFKLMGILESYRRRGIDALLYIETIKAFYEKGYEWLDGSLTSENNPTINLIAQRLGAERYKQYRLYQMRLGG
jgi:GNAT superfamily N-acetyltransferase